MSAFPTARWAEIDALFEQALDRPPDERTAFLRAACGHDPALYRAVTDLLASDAAAEHALGESATDFAAHLLRESAAEPPETLGAGTRIGPYRIEGTLGHGGMGVVYRTARADGTFRKEVALKLVKRGMDTDEVLRRFRYERQILAGLDHPGIARLLDAGAAPDGRPYLVMECVEGEPITRWADRRRLSVEARLDLFERVCEAVTYAHRRLVVHRDLKPSNVLVTDEGAEGQPSVKLLDFGIARLLDERVEDDAPQTRPGWRVLTPEYAAPEQLRGEPATTATDAYALGIILYELLAGTRPGTDPGPPSAAVTDETAAGRRTSANRLRRRLRGDLDTLALAALHPDPARRYASAEAMLDDLRRLRTGLPLHARPDSRRYRLGKFVGRHRVGVAISAAVLILLVAFVGVLLAQQRATARERDRAEHARARAEQSASFLEGLFAAATPFATERLDTLRARDLLDRGRAAAERDLREQPLLQAHLLGVIGRAQMDLGLYDEGETTLRRGLGLLGPPGTDLLEYASLQTALARALYLRSEGEDLAEAEALYRAALATRRDRLGPGHPETASSLNDLALVLVRTGALAEAEQHFREALALHRAASRPDTVQLAATAKNLADLLADLSHYDEAETLLRESVALRRAHLDAEHPTLAVGLQSLATFLRDSERYAEAEPLVREALGINRAALGEDHPHVADNLNLLGSVLRGLGRMDEAADALGEAVARTRAFRSDRHPDLALALNTYAGLLIAQEDYVGAEAVLDEAVGIVRDAYGSDHPAVAFNVARRASARHGQGAHAAAVDGYREALRIFEAHFGAGTLHVALVQGNLGACLVDLGRYAEAEPFLLASLDGLGLLHDAEHTRVTAAQERLVTLYEAWGRPEQVALREARERPGDP